MKYRSFDLEVFDYTSDGAESFSVRVAHAPVGDLTAPEHVTFPAGMRAQLRKLEQGTLSREQIIALGEQLGGLLFPPTVRDYFFRSRERLSAGEGMRVKLRFDNSALAALPWEYSYLLRPGTDPAYKPLDGFLTLDGQTSLVRSSILTAPPDFVPVGARPLKLAALFSDPASPGYPALNLDVEQQKLKTVLTGVANIDALFRSDATVETLQDMLAGTPDIFHFSGHGDFEGTLGATRGSEVGEGSIVLLTDQGGPFLFPAEKLAVNLANKGVRLTVLSACESARADGVNPWSGVAEALIRTGVPAVVAMQYRVRDDDAIAFSRAFYATLTAGKDVDSAVIAGRIAIYNQGLFENRGWGIPVLYLSGDQGELFPGIDAATTTTIDVHPRTTDHPPNGTNGTTAVNKTCLRNAVVSSYTLDQLETLCADIEEAIKDAGEQRQIKVSLDMVSGATLPGKVQSLIQYLDGYGYLNYLVQAVRADRPNLDF
ncbi:MAG: CHAT domain-containing protein [Chloroflexota bacterium]